MKVAFRTDSSVEIGTGHLMRCLTLALELRKQGVQAEFICRELQGNVAHILEAQQFVVHRLPLAGGVNNTCCHYAGWLHSTWQDDAAETQSRLLGDVDTLIVDHYALDHHWESAVLSGGVKHLMVIDDLADRRHACHILLDHNYYVNSGERYHGLIPHDCQVLLGSQYALLREEFAAARTRLTQRSGRVEKILISFGGADMTNEAGKSAHALSSFSGEITLVAGAANPHFAALEAFCDKRPAFRLLRSVQNMAERMLAADLAIGGGGSMSWERACLQLPTLAWPIADNQTENIHNLSVAGVLRHSRPSRLLSDINGLSSDDLFAMSRAASQICDGNGAARVAAHLMCYVQSHPNHASSLCRN